MNRMAVAITAWLWKQHVISEEDRKLYEYAVYSVFLTMIPLLFALVIGVVMKMVVQSLLFTLPFLLLRKYSGGFHASRAWICMISSCAAMALGTALSGWIRPEWWMSMLTAGSVAVIWINSPVENENRPLSESEKAAYGRKARIIAIAFFLLYIFLRTAACDTAASAAALGLMLTAVMQLLTTGKHICKKQK